MAFPATYNFNYYRGDTAQFVARPKSANGSTFALDGFTAQFFIADKRGSTGTQYEADAVIDTATDIVTCTISPATGRSLTPGTYVYDVQVSSNSETIYTLLTGSITVTDDITGAV